MSLRDFRAIGAKGDTGKAERLFKAAVSAFCSLTRPSRRDMTQLDDLTLPLLHMVSVEARRYVAAALSECASAPPGLLSRLADDRIDIAAPLLVRSELLSDVQLIALIGKKGIGHARAIARRPGLNPTIMQLIRALESSIPQTSIGTMPPSAAPVQVGSAAVAKPGQRLTGDDVRERLRGMMRSDKRPVRNAAVAAGDRQEVFVKLREASLTGDDTFFQTALADALRMNFATSRHIFVASSYSPLLAALRSLDLSEEQAYLVASTAMPMHFKHAEAVRLFLTRYRALDREVALDRVRGWKLEMIASWISRNSTAARGKLALRTMTQDLAPSDAPAALRAS